jgi:hypothetical protein
MTFLSSKNASTGWLRIDGAYARARVTFKAARFRAPVKKDPGLVQLRAA